MKGVMYLYTDFTLLFLSSSVDFYQCSPLAVLNWKLKDKKYTDTTIVVWPSGTQSKEEYRKQQKHIKEISSISVIDF